MQTPPSRCARPGRSPACALAPLVLALGGCSSSVLVWIELPSLPERVQSVIVTIDSTIAPSTGGDLLQRSIQSREVFESLPLRIDYPSGPDAEVHVTGLGYSLEQLQLAPGPLPLAPFGTTGRLLPIPEVSFVRSLQGERPSAWDDEDPPEEIVELRLSPIDWSSCVSAGGCWVRNEERPEEELCTLPCPEPAAPASPTAPMPPTLPELPVLTPCPAGWLETAAEGELPVATCAPPVRLATCPVGQYQPLGAASCEAVGAACAADGWPASIPGSRPVLFVRAGASSSGDGTRAAPLGTLGAALARVTPGDGTVVAVSAGEYRESVELHDGVLLLGACAEGTVVSALGPALQLRAGQAEVRDLRIAEGTSAVIVEGGARLAMEGIAIHAASVGALGVGVEARGGALVSGRRVSITGAAFEGVMASEGSRIELSSAVVEGVTRAGVRAHGEGTHVGLTNTRITGVERANPGEVAFGVLVQGRASAALEVVVVEDAASTNLAVDDDASADVRELVVRRGRAEEVASGGIAITNGGSLVVGRARVTENRGEVLYVHEASAVFEDLVVDHTLSNETGGPGGSGLVILEGSTSTITRALFSRTGGVGVRVSGVGARLEAEALTVQDLDGYSDGGIGNGVIVESEATARLERVRVVRARERGIYADLASKLELEDATIEDMLGEALGGAGGEGIVIVGGSRLTAARIAIHRAHAFGLLVVDGSLAHVTDVTIDGVAPSRSSQEVFGGQGLRANGSELDAERVVVRGAVELSLGCNDPGTPVVRITDGLFEGGSMGFVVEGEDADVKLLRVVFRGAGGMGIRVGEKTVLEGEDLVVDHSGTSGVTASGQADLSFTRFRFSDNDATGLDLGDHAVSLKRGVYAFGDGEISRNRIGASVPSDPLLVRTVAERVRYTDNGTAIESR